MIIGIEIGTSYTSASRIGRDGKAEPIELATGMSMYGSKNSLPSAVFVEDNGNVIVGQAAMNSRLMNPRNFIMEFKRLLGQSVPVQIVGKSFLPEDLYTELFRHVKKQAENIGGEPVEKAYITYPASFLETKKNKIISAAQKAGFFQTILVDEPTSAAMCYCATGALKDGQTILVYDFGGGTFDVSLVRYEHGSFSLPTAPLGIERCGGIDIDRIIFSDMMDAVKQEIGEEKLANMDAKRRMRFDGQMQERAVKAKHQFVESDTFKDMIFVENDDIMYELKREKLDSLIAPMVGSTKTLCQDILNNAGLAKSDLSGILMVGGTSRVPLVRKMVEQFAGDVPVIYNIDPELAVAQGAILYKHEMTSEELYLKATALLDETEDSSEGMEYLRKAAEKGFAAAQNRLADCYHEGKGVPIDKAEGVRWYRAAAEQGYVLAQYNLALCYKNGKGISVDQREAVKWYRAAAEQGYVKAQYNLAVCCDNGKGTSVDKGEAVKWYRVAAEHGHVKAQYNLAICYEDGEGTSVNKREAVKWYRAAAEQGHVTAQYNLALCYKNGEGTGVDQKEAVKWYRAAAEQGYVKAQYNLAVCYDNGKGTGIDKREAVKWYRAAAEQGHAKAQYNLAICYEDGEGTSVNQGEAVKWYRAAAEQDHAKAQYALALCYRDGIGVPVNRAEMRKWLKKAAAQGYEDAKKFL